MYLRLGNHDCKIPLINLANAMFNVACSVVPSHPTDGQEHWSPEPFPRSLDELTTCRCFEHRLFLTNPLDSSGV